jgi:outer membrane protein assembly factor BamB
MAAATATSVACGTSSKQMSGQRLATATTDILQHHNNSSKDGLYVDPLFTRDAAANTRRDTAFNATLPGQVYAQPLYVQNGPGGASVLIVATEENAVVAIDSSDGSQVWRTDLDPPANSGQLPCGNIAPHDGVTGTPVIDLDSRIIYVAANTLGDGLPNTTRHKVYALSLDDGSMIDGWPVDIPAQVSFGDVAFYSPTHGERGALLLQNGYLYVPYGGRFGDCRPYHGWVVAIPTADPSNPTAFATDAVGGGVWAPAGLSSDGASVFAATGNTFGTMGVWQGGEAVFRLGDGASFSGNTADYYAPSNWLSLDDSDADLGGVAPILVSVEGAVPSDLIVAVGKLGFAYLLDRANLGGIGGELTSVRIANSSTLINAPATFTAPSGTYVAVASSGNGLGCPGAAGNLVVFQIGASAPPSISIAWCASASGRFAPIVTTTDGTSESVLWTIASGFPSNRLRAYNAETGEVLFDGGGSDEAIGTLKSFLAPIAINGRIFIAGDNQLYAFTTQ